MTAPWGPPRDRVFEAVQSFGIPQPAMSVQSQIERLAASLRGGGERSRKITLIGAGAAEDVSNTALTLARRLSRDSKVLLIGLSTPADAAQMPGLSDLARGVASFGQIINRDTRSPLHIIGAGIQPDRALLTSPRVVMALDALMQTYDHVVLDAGTAAGLPSSLIASQAHAVILPAPGFPDAARATMRAQLLASGFVAVSILNHASTNDAAPEEVAAA
jgi:Mrp family chromosome partitioning ATPase